MWKQEKLQAQLAIVEQIKDHVVISGGLAWHIMSPPHEETKTIHDHSDVDLFIVPNKAAVVLSILQCNGYTRYWTKYDGVTPNFLRYGKTEARYEDEDELTSPVRYVKVLLDLFIEPIESIEVDGWAVVKPEVMLPLYETSHASKECTAVKAAIKLVAKGINPVKRMELIGKKHGKHSAAN